MIIGQMEQTMFHALMIKSHLKAEQLLTHSSVKNFQKRIIKNSKVNILIIK